MSFLNLAKKINQKGDQFIKRHGIEEFHKKASELLLKSHILEKFEIRPIVESVFNTKNIQHFKNLEFSDLPITISQGESCFIDIYFWRRRPTVIHNHHFTGAFMCLSGSNVDLEFKFKKTTKLGKFHDLGELTLKQTRNLLPGDIAEIDFMGKFIHQNHHQANLTVNLCFRTPQDPKKSLSNYLYSGLRYEKNVDLLARVGRLHKMLDLGLFDPDKIKISNDDAINFLIQTHETRSQNPRLLNLRKELLKRIKNEFGVSVSSMLKEHEVMMEKIENDYE
jgi:hypothetical protein